MKRCVIGIDNGVSGSICVIHDTGEVFYTKAPTFEQLSYQKEKKYFTRIKTSELRKWLRKNIDEATVIRCYLERPFVNPKAFNATLSAVRAYEATLVVIEELGIPYSTIDSQEWQKDMLPKGIINTKKSKDKKERKTQKKEAKRAADDIARKLFPSVPIDFEGGGDGLLIAEWARKKWFTK
ncbi:MAG: hypothetical protein WC554_12160 [Clostridia bacterium]|jgi:6-phosphofructokinase